MLYCFHAMVVWHTITDQIIMSFFKYMIDYLVCIFPLLWKFSENNLLTCQWFRNLSAGSKFLRIPAILGNTK